jgi:hypothetical protein
LHGTFSRFKKKFGPQRGARKREKRKGGNGKREEWSSYALRGYGVTSE